MLSLIPLSLLAFPTAHAWGVVGHEIIATIAMIHLEPTALDKICSILNMSPSSCHLAPIATWADQIRDKMSWSGPLHYVNPVNDHPPQSCDYSAVGGKAGQRRINVLGAISNYTNILQDKSQGDLEKNEALKFLIHFIGDMHQPLHLVERQQGGNKYNVTFDGLSTNLHMAWDTLIISKYLRTIPSNYTQPLPTPDASAIERYLRGTIYDPYIRQIFWEGFWDRWKGEAAGWNTCPILSAPSTWGSIKEFLRFTPLSNWVAPQAADPAEEWDTKTLCPYSWTKPIHALNCQFVWPKETDRPRSVQEDGEEEPRPQALSAQEEMDLLTTLPVARAQNKDPELDDPEYLGAIQSNFVIEKLLAQGGLRLAYVLNSLYA